MNKGREERRERKRKEKRRDGRKYEASKRGG